ncbi:hypothetical protein [Botrimarina sp.]|uniref:hypothetical protein n=1 Tax=Botrimarina sp. TaxID=2795802 RepID=UPI0032EB80CD
MSTTDRAFIAAFQQSEAAWPAAAQPASSEPRRRLDAAVTSGLGGPRSAAADKPPAGEKAPLSEHLARRRAATHAPAVDTPLRAGVEVHTLVWPAIVDNLIASARKELLELVASATRQGQASESPVVTMVAARQGVGCTTTLLAIARLLAKVGGRVAIIDAGRGGAAAQLGVRRAAPLPSSATAEVVDDNLVVSRECSTCLLAAGVNEPGAFAVAAIDRLAATHDLVLVDGGLAESINAWTTIAASHAGAATLLVDAAGDQAARRAAVEWLAAADAAPLGVVETLIDAPTTAAAP